MEKAETSFSNKLKSGPKAQIKPSEGRLKIINPRRGLIILFLTKKSTIFIIFN